MDKKTKSLQLRLTPKEVAWLKEKASAHDSVSQYILCAVKEFSNFDANQRLVIINIIGKNYRKGMDSLSWAGGNINQTVKRTKELVDAGKISPYYLYHVLLPEANKALDLINEIKKKLEAATDKAIRFGLITKETPENAQTDQPI